MSTTKQIQPGEKVPLKLTESERKLILEGLMCIDPDYERIIRDALPGKPVMMTLDDLDDFGGYIAAEANHCDDKKKQKKLDIVFRKIEGLLEKYTDEEPPQTILPKDTKQSQALFDQAAQIAEWAEQTLLAAEQLRIKTKPIDHFWLAPGHREVLLLVPGISKAIKNKLAKDKPVTVAEVVKMTIALTEDLPDGKPHQRLAVLLVAAHLIDQAGEGIVRLAESKRTKTVQPKTRGATGRLFQFKITLLGIRPTIWRRIQV